MKALVGFGIVLLFAIIANVEARHPCGPVCAIHCPYGNVLDSRGCPTCRCRKGPWLQPPGKCGPICYMLCPNGFVKDSRGCPICRCRSY